MFIQKKIFPIALALLCILPGAAMATTQVLVTYKNAPSPTILANLGVPSGSQLAQQSLANQIAVQAAAMQQTNPALVGAVITGDTASVPYNGYQTSSLKTGFGYQQPANGNVLFADLINVLPTTPSGSSSSSSANNSAALQAQLAALKSQLAQAQASNGSPGVYYSSTAANALVQSLSTSSGGSHSAALPNGMTVHSGAASQTWTGSGYVNNPATYSITYGSGTKYQSGLQSTATSTPPSSSGLTASQAAAILASSIQGVGGVS